MRTFAGDLQWLAYCLRSVAKFAQPYVDSVTVNLFGGRRRDGRRVRAVGAPVGANQRVDVCGSVRGGDASRTPAQVCAVPRWAVPTRLCSCGVLLFSLALLLASRATLPAASVAPRATPSTATRGAAIFDKLCADLYVPAARFVLHLDSDTVLTRPLAFSDVFDPRTRKPLMPRVRYAPGSEAEWRWRAVTADLVGIIKAEELEFQFMPVRACATRARSTAPFDEPPSGSMDARSPSGW